MVRATGCGYLRIRLPIYRSLAETGSTTQPSRPGYARNARLGIVPIIDLVHFGLPDFLQDFQNPQWPEHFAQYAADFARRYPWVRYYTPINEIYITARFSAAFGWWNERKTSDVAFVTHLKHSVKAAMLSMRPSSARGPMPSSSFPRARNTCIPGAPAWWSGPILSNERRFLAQDLLFSHDVSAAMYRYLLGRG